MCLQNHKIVYTILETTNAMIINDTIVYVAGFAVANVVLYDIFWKLLSLTLYDHSITKYTKISYAVN